MPRAHWNVEMWRNTVHHCSELPPIRDPSLWINRHPAEVLKVLRPGYCYLTLFKEQYHEAFDWPAFPTWSKIALWDENLRREGKYRVTVMGRIWHIEEDEIRGESWMMVQYLALGKHSSERVGIFLWMVEMANTLMNALSGYQFYFGKDAPEYRPIPPVVPPPEVPPVLHAEYVANREEVINHNVFACHLVAANERERERERETRNI